MTNSHDRICSLFRVGTVLATVGGLAVLPSLLAPPVLNAGPFEVSRTSRSTVRTELADRTRALLVGGGPAPDHNQIAIESNVRYLLKLLPAQADRTVLFADGDKQKETVLYEAAEKPLKPAEQLLALLLAEREDAHPAQLKFRKPSIPQIDGPSKKEAVTAAFDKLVAVATPGAPILLYFTGHGSRNKGRDLENNSYDLWNEGSLSVRELAAEIARVPASQPITLVMVQCYSGAFANLLFQDGDPSKPPVEREIAGFFAAIKERMAAGCTPEVDEAEYRDFTSYFFAALSGRDRVGRPVTGADFNRDGRVTMDEAYCYTLVNDASIDVPVCTSDIFVRKVVLTPDAKVFETPYSTVLSWTTPAQRAGLEQLSAKLKLNGENRAAGVYDQLFGPPQRRQKSPGAAAAQAFLDAKDEGRRLLFSRWPDLRDEKSTAYAAAKKEALQSLDRWIQDGKFKAVFDADNALYAAEEQSYKHEIEQARLIRFVRLYKSVVLAHQLRESGDSGLRKRFEKLVAAEGRRPSFLDSNDKAASLH
jgi:hypothetical protein